jgi:hypothetical protein
VSVDDFCRLNNPNNRFFCFFTLTVWKISGHFCIFLIYSFAFTCSYFEIKIKKKKIQGTFTKKEVFQRQVKSHIKTQNEQQ